MKQLWHDYMQLTDKQLDELRFDQTPEGKYARKEIHRRKMVGYCDGTAIDRGVNLDGTQRRTHMSSIKSKLFNNYSEEQPVQDESDGLLFFMGTHFGRS